MVKRSAKAARSGRKALKTFLAAPSRPAGTLQYHQLYGFLFAVTSSPELILPSEWMPIVFGDQGAGYRSLAEGQSIIGEVMSVYNEINAGVVAGQPALPGGCEFRDDPLENLDPDTPVSQWAQGYMLGHDWLLETWEHYLPDDDEDKEFGSLVLVLSFFAGRRLAEAYRKEFKLRRSLQEAATTVRGLFPDALREYARLGRMIAAVVAEHDASRTVPGKAPGKSRKPRSR